MRTAVALILVAGLAAPAFAADPPARFPIVSDDEAWKQLPREQPPLPAWARTLIGPLPRTIPLLLELDHVQREKNPLGAALAAKVHWAAADTLGWEYGRRVYELDMRRAKVKDEEIKALAGPIGELPDDERRVIAFARQLTRAAYTVTDEQVAALIEKHGVEKVVGMAHTVAYVNFLGRVCLALGVAVEPGGPFPAPEVKWDKERLDKLKAPPRKDWAETLKAEVPSASMTRPEWDSFDFAVLQKKLDGQEARKSRVPVPDLPPDIGRSSRIVWSRVSMGYQPTLTRPWFNAMNAAKEGGLDPVFDNSVFWVITRTNDCFY